MARALSGFVENGPRLKRLLVGAEPMTGGLKSLCLGLSLSAAERQLLPIRAVFGMMSVASLLAWVYGLGRFATRFWAVSVSGMAVLVAMGSRAPEGSASAFASITCGGGSPDGAADTPESC